MSFAELESSSPRLVKVPRRYEDVYSTFRHAQPVGRLASPSEYYNAGRVLPFRKVSNWSHLSTIRESISTTDTPEDGEQVVSFNSSITAIQGLTNLFTEFYISWMEKINLSPGAKALCSEVSVNALFSRALAILQRYYSSTMPCNDFLNGFALLNLAPAMVYSVHGDDESYAWDELSRDMLVCLQASSEGSDAANFNKVTGLGLSQAPFGDLSGISIERQEKSHEIWSRLKNGRMLQGCSTFLDGESESSAWYLKLESHLIPCRPSS